jgi:signal peptidase II
VKKLKPIYYVIYTAAIIGGIVLDQISKLIAVKLLAPIGSVPLWEGVLHLTYVENKGAAFGMLADQRWIFMSISSVAIIAIALYLYSGRNESKLYCGALTLIISGGIGNMIDRIALGYVIDFIDFCAFPEIWKWVFNVADSFVCVGAGIMILWLILDMIRDYKAEKAAKACEDAKDDE